MKKRVAVIGAGPAGMMAAGQAAKRGLDVILLENNDIAGKKLLITGKGRCNFTNDTDIDGLIANIPGNGKFLYSAFNTFSNKDLIVFFNQLGVNTKVERGGRVFPLSDRSKDVVEALVKFLKNTGARLITKAPVSDVIASEGKVRAVVLKDGRSIECDSAIIATGGISYPGTGSTGDGFKIAGRLGHTIIEPKPSLVPLITEEAWVKELSGLTLKNIAVVFKDKSGRKIYEDFGELLFTHFGVSGPVILSASRHVMDFGYKGTSLHIDLKPALNEEKLYERIQRDFIMYSRKQFKNSLNDLLPKKLIPVFVHLLSIPPEKPVNQITKEERKSIVRLLKDFKLNICRPRPIEEAIVTAGGVCTNEIDPQTMESKLIKGLFFAGEIIDVDGYTGGFNLTIAFSTGYVAGIHC